MAAACGAPPGSAGSDGTREPAPPPTTGHGADEPSDLRPEDATPDASIGAEAGPGPEREDGPRADDLDELPGPVAAPGPPPEIELSDSEVLPDAKRVASEVVQQLTTYDPADTAAEVAGRVVPGHAVDELVRMAGALYHDGAWSRGEIVYPQLGGATETQTSVMVVVRQSIGAPDGTTREEVRTVDVRLTLDGGAWAFDGIADAGGQPVPRPDDLPPEAAAVLDDDRIELPDSAVWDIHAGRTATSLLEVMSLIADRHRYGVVVLETGHPIHVFDTDRISMHLYGLAVDIYHLDDVLIVDDRHEGSAAHELARWLYQRPEVTNLGSPWALDAFGGRSFTDQVHQDHFHVEAGNRPDGPPAHRRDLQDAGDGA